MRVNNKEKNMTSNNRLGYFYEKSFHLHRMNDCDDLNLYYQKFLNKLSKISLKIFLPLLPLIYLFTLFLCRLFLFDQTNIRFDLRTLLSLICIFATFILLFLIRLHTKWKTVWFSTRILLIALLMIPLILTYQTDQYHLLLSTISITLIYALLTFTLIQSLIICSSISILHIILLINMKNAMNWKSFEFLSLIFYHLIINLAGLYTYIRSMKHIREHFHAYEKNLYEKNKFNVDCKKLNLIHGHCQQPQRFLGRLSKLSNGLNINGQTTKKFGAVINCNFSLNEQTRVHTCDELASLFDVLFCQIEQLILKDQSQAKYIFDNENLVIILLNDNDDEEEKMIDQTCRLAIELFRFIQHVNNVTQWNLTTIIGIDYNQLNVYSSEYIQGLAYDYSRWLREECLIINRIHVASKIYQILKENKFYEFHAYSWLNKKNLFETSPTYFLFSANMYEAHHNLSTTINNSSMIDQLTRIQAQYHVEKHLGTITLTRSLRKRSLIELTSKHLNWLSLNFKDQQITLEQNLQWDFRSTHRADRPKICFYLFILFILLASVCQSWVIGHLTWYYLIIFPTIILTLIFIIVLFLYTINADQQVIKGEKNRKFQVYFNQMICLTLSTLFVVAAQYHSIENFKYLFQTNDLSNGTMVNESSSQINQTNIRFDDLQSTISFSSPFDRRYHEYLVLSPIYALYLCLIYRQCSWIIKTFFIISCLIVQLCLYEYVWLTTNFYFPSITPLHHYTAFTLIIFHGLLLIICAYVREWLEKIDFVWLKQIDNERITVLRQRDELIKQTSAYLPLRVIHYYLRTDSDLALSQHYHIRYDRMGLLYVNFVCSNMDDEYILVDYLNDLEYLLKNNEKYLSIVLHKKSTIKEMIFSIDINCSDSVKYLQQLVELLLQLDERLKQISLGKIQLSACLHIACVNEILIHLEKYPKIDIWSDHIPLMQLLISKTQVNHCLTTASVYHLLNDLYLFRTAGSIINTQVNTENNTNIYYLLGRLIGDNVFQGRNALPLTISQTNVGTVQKSSSTDDSHRSQSSQLHCQLNSHSNEAHHIQTSTTTTTTSSSVILNEQQSLLKQPSSSSRKHVRISNHLENSSYRHTLLQALNGTTNASSNHQQQISPIKKFSNRLLTKKQMSPPISKDFCVPRMIHLSDNSCWSSREAMTQSETSGSKCLILTQQMLNGSIDDNIRCKSTPPPPPPLTLPPNSSSARPFSGERKSFTEEDFRQLVQDHSIKDNPHPSRSLSTTNEETASSFSGWDDVPPSPLPSIKSNHNTTPSQPQQDSVKSPMIDCYYPRRPCDLSFTVNMTTEDDNSSRTDTKSTVIASPTSTVVTITSPLPPPVPPPSVVNNIKPVVISPHHPPLPTYQQQIVRYRPVPFNLARKLVAETSESALSELSVDQHHEPWTQNIAYQSKRPQRTRLSSSYSNLHDLLHLNDSAKYLSKQMESPPLVHGDLLQRWLEDQLNLFQHQIKHTPPVSARRSNRLSANIHIGNDSTDDESDTVSENTFPSALTNQSKSHSSNKRPYNHVRYKPLRRNANQTSHLIRHESLKYRNRPLSIENNSQINQTYLNYSSNQMKKLPRRTDSSSMPRSDLSDISSSRPDNLSESVMSNLESEYDNIYTQPSNINTAAAATTTTIMNNSQILSEEDDDDETTLATTITTMNRCYF